MTYDKKYCVIVFINIFYYKQKESFYQYYPFEYNQNQRFTYKTRNSKWFCLQLDRNYVKEKTCPY